MKIGLNTKFNIYQTEQNPNREKIKQTEKLSRVEEIKKQIQNGSYKIDIEKTSKAMAKSLL